MPLRGPLPLLLCLLACRPKAVDEATPATRDSGPGNTTDTAGSKDTADTAAPMEFPSPSYSMGSCPTLVEGTNTAFVSGGIEREFELRLPPNPAGAPVVFAWHKFGGSPTEVLRSFDLERWAGEEGAIIVAPASDGYVYEWRFLDAPEGNPDLLLFEDLLACVNQQFAPDKARVYALGFSAGGLWTTYLTLHDAQWLSAAAPFSGGITPGPRPTPYWPLPVLITWGGPRDTFDGYSLDYASRTYSEGMQANGSFVVECEHDGRHTLPDEAEAYAWRFFADHPRGRPEPYTAGLPDDFPAWCRVP